MPDIFEKWGIRNGRATEIPEQARIFRNSWAAESKNAESAILDDVFFDRQPRKAVFLNLTFVPSWGEQYFEAERALNVAADTLVRTGKYGVRETPSFSPKPDFLIDETGWTPYIWINAAVARAGEETWNAAVSAAKEELRTLEEVKKADGPDSIRAIAIRDQLRKRGLTPSFSTGRLAPSEGEIAVNDLLRRMGIK